MLAAITGFISALGLQKTFNFLRAIKDKLIKINILLKEVARAAPTIAHSIDIFNRAKIKEILRKQFKIVAQKTIFNTGDASPLEKNKDWRVVVRGNSKIRTDKKNNGRAA